MNNGLKTRLSSGCAMVLIGAQFCAQNAFSAEPVPEKGRQVLTTTLRPPGNSAGPAVKIVYEAVVYETPEVVPTSGQSTWDPRTPESSFRASFLANKSGNADLIVRGFAPAEQEKIRGMVSKKDMLEKNTSLYSRILKCQLLQKTFYGDYVILTAFNEDNTGKSWRSHYAMKNTPEGWLLSNDLASDKVYGQLLDMISVNPAARTN